MDDAGKRFKIGFLTAVMLIVAGLFSIGGGNAADSPPPAASLPAMLAQPGCYLPVAALTLFALAIGSGAAYYAAQRMNALVRTWQAEADYAEARAAQRQRQVDDLTLTPTGQPVPRLLHDPQGRTLLVNPGVVTRSITPVDADAGIDESESLRAGAILSHALAQIAGGAGASGSGNSGGIAPETLLLLLNGRSLESPAERIPPHVRVLTAEEVEVLDDHAR